MDYAGIDAKLKRAIAKLNDLYRLVRAYREREPYSIRVDEQPREHGRFVGRLVAVKNPVVGPPGPEMVLLAGEVLYQLRSALDHLICQLVIENGFGDTIETHRRHQFPIFETSDGYHSRAGTMTWNVPESANALIVREQPYSRFPDAPRGDVLLWLDKLNNTDKHRMIPVTVVGIDVIYVSDVRGIVRSVQSENIALKDEQVVLPFSVALPPEEQVSAKLSTTVAFRDVMNPYGVTLGIDGVLLAMANRVGEIIQAFKRDFP